MPKPTRVDLASWQNAFSLIMALGATRALRTRQSCGVRRSPRAAEYLRHMPKSGSVRTFRHRHTPPRLRHKIRRGGAWRTFSEPFASRSTAGAHDEGTNYLRPRSVCGRHLLLWPLSGDERVRASRHRACSRFGADGAHWSSARPPNGLEVNPRGQGPHGYGSAARRLPAFEARGAGGVTPSKSR